MTVRYTLNTIALGEKPATKHIQTSIFVSDILVVEGPFNVLTAALRLAVVEDLKESLGLGRTRGGFIWFAGHANRRIT